MRVSEDYNIHTINQILIISLGAIQNFPGLFVAAAGNSGLNTDGVIKSFPAGYASDTVVSGEVIVDREQVVYS